ncbi:MAG: adenosylcobinamide-GDP ribazoletransferase [Clostridium sp.]
MPEAPSGRERKLEILKDPHAGAFAIAGCSVYLLLYTAAFSELRLEAFPAIGGIYVMTRALSGLSVLCFPKARRMDWQPRLPKEPETEHRQSKQCWQSGSWWESRLQFWCRCRHGE